MLSKHFRAFVALSFITLFATPVFAQTIPSPAQAQQMLQNDPSLLGRLQGMMQSSGLTPDQVRDRLKAQGYPQSLLDQYMPGSTSADPNAVPGDDAFGALRALGIGDSLAVDSLRIKTRMRASGRALLDSAFLDTLKKAVMNDSTRAAVRSLLRSKDMQREQADSGFVVFGLDLFHSDETTQFDPNTSGAADANYRFGPGDKLVLFLTGDVERSYQLSVNRDGFVVIPDVGQIDVAGLTRDQLENSLFSRLGRVYSGVRRGTGATTHFYIDVAQMGTNQVYVNGDVAHPSSYRVSRAGTVMTALYMAGGPTGNGSMRNVQVRRNGQVVATMDIYDYALHGDASNDVRLEGGDIIFVPPRGPQVRVAGAVLRPATYEVKPGQSLGDVVQMAGGLTETADRRRIQIERVVPPAERTSAGRDRSILDVPADVASTTPVRAGDVIRVLTITKRVANRVTVKGNVWSQGPVAFTPGMRLSTALHNAGGLKPDSYLGRVLIARLNPDSTRELLRTAVYDTTGRAVDDQLLADGDEITVFSTTAFRPQRYITITGAVRKSGQVPYREGMTLRDAVLLADGLQDGALLTNAEVAHLPENRQPGVTAVSELVPLDSTYLFERTADGRYTGPPGIAAPEAKAPEVVLHPYDAILIKRQAEWQLPRSVSVQGEVKSPGDYTLTSKTDRLSDIVKRAGGLTSSAYPTGIVFVRKRAALTKAGSDTAVLLRLGGGTLTDMRIGVDLPAVLRNPNTPDNITLVEGDSIFIPQYTPVVMVSGAVNAPTGIAYRPGANIDYYVRSAGGENTKGDADRAYVAQPGGKLETRRSHTFWAAHKPVPQPGSTVYVPDKDPTVHRDWAVIAASITSILGSLVALAAIAKN
jgi:protein involved in polysaccharide export with SLBB domain